VSAPDLYVGLMSGTSLDGVDAVVAHLPADAPRVLASAHRAFDPALRSALLELSAPGENELDRAAALGNELARRYFRAVEEALAVGGIGRAAVRAIGCHGQTVRHRPERGYTIQIGNPALLAELTGLTVVADFRSRDIAAGGQGAPLVPAFHAAVFSHRDENRAVLNLGGIANLTLLPRQGPVVGFDCGPGNCLLDLWAWKHLGKPFDDAGSWAAGGRVSELLLARLLDEPFFAAAPPKSTGRELFNEGWLAARLQSAQDPRAIQATLLELTARSVTDACRRFAAPLDRMLVCGGGTRNTALLGRLQELLAPVPVEPTGRHGFDPLLVEAAAFAWLAKQALAGVSAGLPSVTGARGARVLGAIYPR
jgi:anhydro-N-acetylmuramic acid kinase